MNISPTYRTPPEFYGVYVDVYDQLLENAADAFDVWAMMDDLLMSRLRTDTGLTEYPSLRGSRQRIKELVHYVDDGEPYMTYVPCSDGDPDAVGWTLRYVAEIPARQIADLP